MYSLVRQTLFLAIFSFLCISNAGQAADVALNMDDFRFIAHGRRSCLTA